MESYLSAEKASVEDFVSVSEVYSKSRSCKNSRFNRSFTENRDDLSVEVETIRR